MNANRLFEEWRRRGRILKVEGANTVLWRMGQERVICVHGVPTSGFLYRKLPSSMASPALPVTLQFDLRTGDRAPETARIVQRPREYQRSLNRRNDVFGQILRFGGSSAYPHQRAHKRVPPGDEVGADRSSEAIASVP
jgi:hypothetical protein